MHNGKDEILSDASILARVRLFSGLDADKLAKIGQAAHRRKLKKNSFFFQQGENAHNFYVLLEGHVKVTQVTPDGDEVLLRFIQPGEMFGGCAAFGEPVYPSTAHAVEDCVAIGWDVSTMHALMQQCPSIALNALEWVAARLRETQDRYRELATQRVERRLAQAVIRLAKENGHRVEHGVLIDLPLSRQDLAEMTGTTLYTVSRILSEWEGRELVEAGRKRLLVRSVSGLLKIVEDY